MRWLKRQIFWVSLFLGWALGLGGAALWNRQKQDAQAYKDSLFLRKAQDLQLLRESLQFLEANQTKIKQLLQAQRKVQTCSLMKLTEKFAELGKCSGLKDLSFTLRSASQGEGRGAFVIELIFSAPCEDSCFSFVQLCWQTFPGVFLPQTLFLESRAEDFCPSEGRENVKGHYLLAYMTE